MHRTLDRAILAGWIVKQVFGEAKFMHPNTFLKTFWQMDLKPQVFVAMSFAEKYSSRFADIIRPAIESIAWGGQPLKPHRVDISKTGDSILTEIMDGIAHSVLVLADISTIGKDSVTGDTYRNANVMYEVGVALSCRQPTDLLLIRDDHDKLLFDVSTIPHSTYDFTDQEGAKQRLQQDLIARLQEQNFVNDARVQMASSSLVSEEIKHLSRLDGLADNQGMFEEWKGEGMGFLYSWHFSMARLIDKKIVTIGGYSKSGMPIYQLTKLGKVVAQNVLNIKKALKC